ncbi:MAG: M23 family metallopeptidase [Hyphomicrobiaceae bacterium]
MPDLFVADQADARRGGGFRWFFSTCLAAMVGAIAIRAVIFGSIDLSVSPARMVANLKRTGLPSTVGGYMSRRAAIDGLNWSIPKSERLQTTMDAVSTRYIVQDTKRERRGNREYLENKPFARVLIRLAAVEPDPKITIPRFNPLKLFASPAREGQAAGEAGTSGPEGGEVVLRIVDLLGSILPADDGQVMDNREVTELVARSLASEFNSAPIRPGFAPEGLSAVATANDGESHAPNTTQLIKTTTESDDVEDEVAGEVVRTKLARGQTLTSLLVRMGAPAWQAREMVDSARGVLPESAATPGHTVEVTLVPSLSDSGATEPARFSVFGPGGEHKVTVERNEAGEFVASATQKANTIAADKSKASQRSQGLSRFASVYYGALAQGVSPDTIEMLLRLHAYEADFRRKARGSDALEMFFDLKEADKGADGALGELLLTSITIGGTTHKFYRYRSADGGVDYFDPSGNNSRRFLLRKPVRSEDVRLTSGFGLRRHPLLNQRKLHTGIDWAGRSGTPIVAGANGTIEEARYRGQYGNYVRIRHANGYQTAYGHMRSFASGIQAGTRVRQGQVIGYIGSTGLSSGPHVHYEVLVNGRFVDPLSIQVPREKRLTGRQLASFQRERVRIDALMRRPPVSVRTVEANN